MEQIITIAEFILDSFIHIWPYLVVTIPLAVFVKLSGASKFISRAMSRKPLVSIFLATIVGAFSPFCSCGVIPVIASLLIGGVPLAPVMSFWIASPSMDPEIFFLSTAAIGWDLSLWRLFATFSISLFAGIFTQMLMTKGWLGEDILKEGLSDTSPGRIDVGFSIPFTRLKEYFNRVKEDKKVEVQFVMDTGAKNQTMVNCCVPVPGPVIKLEGKETGTCNSRTCKSSTVSFRRRLLAETWKATWMVAKFMSLAFFINALIQFYVPSDFISDLLGGGGFSSIAIASIVGVPLYTSNITALPLIGGLLEMGMNKGAALAFLISGPMTTLPAMAAVWGLVRRKIFMLYISCALFGAVIFGILVNFLG